MEDEKKSRFPWLNDVIQDLSSSLLVDYNNGTLSVLHWNIDEEIKKIYSSDDQALKRAEALYKEISYLYEHMRLKISQHSDFQNATFSCVKLVSQLIKVGLVLTQGLINSKWIDHILTAIKLFPGNRQLMFDALLLVNGLKTIHQKPYCTILRCIMSEDYHEFVTDPLVYMEMIFLFRRLKALVLNRYKEKYTLIVTKIKPPSNLISWLASLDVYGYSSYLKRLKYKKIALQLMTKTLPESFLKKIRFMALNKYNFEDGDNKFKTTGSEDQPSDIFIIDNTSSTKCDNLDILINSPQAITKKNIKTLKGKKKLHLKENTVNKEPRCKTEVKNVVKNEFGINITNHKHITNSTNKSVIVSKKKNKYKHNINKSRKVRTSSEIRRKDAPDDDSFFQNFECSSTSEKLNKNVKHFPNAIECNIPNVSSKHRLVKNTELDASDVHSENVPDNILFFYDLKGSNASKKLKSIYSVSNSVLLKRNVSEDTDSNTTVKSILQKNKKKLKSSKDNEKPISSDYLSKDFKSDSSPDIESHVQIISKNKGNKQDNPVKKDATLVFEEDIAGKKRKNIASIDDSSGKCMYFKKLMLKEVNIEPSIENASTELESKNSGALVEKKLKMLNSKQTNKNVTDNFVRNSLVSISDQNAQPNNAICNTTNIHDSALGVNPVNDVIVQSPEKAKFIMKPKVSDELSTPEITTIKESGESIVENLNPEFKKENNLVKKSYVSLHFNDMIAASVSDMQCENNKIKHDLEKSEMALKPIQVSNEKSTFSPECSNLKVVSENEVVLSQNLNLENCTDIKDNTNCASNASNSVNLSSVTGRILNQNQQVSNQGTVKYVSSSSTLISLNACENHVNVIQGRDINNSSKEKNSCSTVLEEFAVKTNLESENIKVFSEGNIQKNISSSSDNISHPITLDSMKSEKETSSCDFGVQNVVNTKYTGENSSNVEIEAKSEIKKNSAENISLNISLVHSTSNCEKNKNTIKGIVSKDMSIKTVLCINENSDVAKKLDTKCMHQKYTREKTNFETTLEILSPGKEKEISENIEDNSWKSDNPLVNIEKLLETENTENLDKLSNKKTSQSLLVNEAYVVHKSPLSQNSSKISVIKNCSTDIDESSKKLNCIDSKYDIVTSKENTESNMPIVSSCIDDRNILVNNPKIFAKEEENNLKVLIESEKAASTIEKLRKVIVDSSENILSSNESTYLDNMDNSVSDVKILVKETESTFPLLRESENHVDAYVNSDQLNVFNSQNNTTIGNENIRENLSNESACSKSAHNLVNDIKILLEDILESFQLSFESKNVEETLSNSKKLSLEEKTIDMNIPSIQSIESNCTKLEKPSVKISKDCEKDSVCSLESQEHYIVIDESNSDVEDSNSNYSEKSGENEHFQILKISPVKDIAGSDMLNFKRNNNKSSIKADAITKSNFENYISCNNDSHKNAYEENNHQIKQVLNKVIFEVSLESCTDEIVNTKSPVNDTIVAISQNTSDVSIENCSCEVDSEISSEFSLSNIKKDLLMIADDIECSLTDSKKILTSAVSVMENECSQHRIESMKELEMKCTEVNNLITKQNPLELSESIFLPSFCGEKKYESFSEISSKFKDKKMNLESVSSVPINNFSSSASTELFSMYRNEVMHDEDKTDVSLSSRDCVLSNWQENEEIKSQSCSSSHSDEDMDSRGSSQEEEEENTMGKLISSEASNIPSKNIDETLLHKNNGLHNSKVVNDVFNDGNIDDDSHEKTSNIEIYPRQSLRLKNKTEFKSKENCGSDPSNLQESCKKELRLVLIDCKSSLENDNDLNLAIENKSGCSTLENNENIGNQASVSERNLLKSKGKSKQNSAGYNTSDKRYSLRRRKSNQSKDDSANLGLDLNKLKFDSSISKHTRSRRESKFVKLLTSHIKLQNSPSDVKGETHSSVIKFDVETEPNATCYNLRNRKSIIAPPKLKI